jgi:hypothetical protein
MRDPIIIAQFYCCFEDPMDFSISVSKAMLASPDGVFACKTYLLNSLLQGIACQVFNEINFFN